MLSTNKNFRIPLNHKQALTTGINDANVYNYVSQVPNLAQALNDYNGYENTAKFITAAKALGVYTSGYLYGIVETLRFPNNDKNIYVPSCGEQKIMIDNQTEIDNCLSLLNSDTLSLCQTSTASPVISGWSAEVWSARANRTIALGANGGWYAGWMGADVIGKYD